LGSPEFLVSIFGEKEVDFTNGGSANNHIIREAPKGYDGPCCNFQIFQLSFLANYVARGRDYKVLHRFASWLKRWRKKLAKDEYARVASSHGIKAVCAVCMWLTLQLHSTRPCARESLFEKAYMVYLYFMYT
jgi:hypothetical protein